MSSQERSLFSVPERIGISIAAMVLFGFVLWCLAEMGDDERFWSDAVRRIINALPATVVRISFFLVPLLADLTLGIVCFLCFRRNPLAGIRIFWALAGFVFFVGLALLTRVRLLEEAWTLSSWTYMPGQFGRLVLLLTCFPVYFVFFIGLLLVFLAGELCHSARLRLMQEQLNEVAGYTPREYDRACRRQGLILALHGSNRPVYAAASRLAALAIMPTLATYWTSKLYLATMLAAIAAQPILIPESAGHDSWRRLVVIESSGRVLLDGALVVAQSDAECFGLINKLRHLIDAEFRYAGMEAYRPQPVFAGMVFTKVGLIVAPEVRMQRIMQVLEAIDRGGVLDVAFIDSPVP